MISTEIKESIKNWAKDEYKDNAEAVTFLATQYILDDNLNWLSKSDRLKVEKYIKPFYDDRPQNTKDYIEGYGKHDGDDSFELSLDEALNYSNKNKENNIESDGIENEKHEELLSDDDDIILEKEDNSNRIKDAPYPDEVKELLKELDDQNYKSPVLYNLSNIGYLKLIRKAKILAWLTNSQLL